eukprot:362874-Chlamydomonas_euryale.AAC.1
MTPKTPGVRPRRRVDAEDSLVSPACLCPERTLPRYPPHGIPHREVPGQPDARRRRNTPPPLAASAHSVTRPACAPENQTRMQQSPAESAGVTLGVKLLGA